MGKPMDEDRLQKPFRVVECVTSRSNTENLHKKPELMTFEVNLFIEKLTVR